MTNGAVEKSKSPIDSLPPPEKVRERLSQNIRENRLLRQLLKLSSAVHCAAHHEGANSAR